ncbi:MAG: CPBP family intramembrane glutamic endopeptidase [Elusimicrobiales bacterium]
MNKVNLIDQFFFTDIFSLDSKEILQKESVSLSLWGISVFLIIFLSVLVGFFFEENFSICWHLFKNFLTMFFLIFFFKKINYNFHKLTILFRYNLRNIKKYLFASLIYLLVFLLLVFIFSVSFGLASKVFGEEKTIDGILNTSYSLFELNLRDKFLYKKTDFCLYVFSLCVLTPVTEEIFYRRFLYVALRKKFSFKLSMLICSLIFAFLHFPEIIVSFFAGCLLCYAYEREGNLSVPIIIHSIKNFVAVFYIVFAT